MATTGERWEESYKWCKDNDAVVSIASTPDTRRTLVILVLKSGYVVSAPDLIQAVSLAKEAR